MNYIDIIIIFLIILGLYKGFKLGLIEQIYSLFILFISFYLSIKFHKKLLLFYLDKYNQIFFRYGIKKEVFNIISFFLTLLIIIIIIFIIKKIIEYGFHFFYIYWINKVLGSFLGGLKYFFYISIFIFFLYKIDRYKLFKFNILRQSYLFNKIIDINFYMYFNIINSLNALKFFYLKKILKKILSIFYFI